MAIQYPNFGNTLMRLRKGKGLNQAQLARLISVTRATLSLYETSKGNPSAKQVKALAEVLGVSTDFLLMGKDGVEAYMGKSRVRRAVAQVMLDQLDAIEEQVKLMRELVNSYIT